MLFIACDDDNDVFYDKVARIYFPTDSINYSFGDKPFNIQEHIVMFPVKIMGGQTNEVRKFTIEIDEDKTNAAAGIQFSELPTEFQVMTDSVNGYIPIELIRSGIEGETIYKISLKITDGGDFVTGVKESLTAVLSFNNYLEKPDWWGWMENSLGVYQQEKYQKYIEIHGSAIDASYVGSNFIAVMKEFKKVKDFFDAHPEYGVVFPADGWWP